MDASSVADAKVRKYSNHFNQNCYAKGLTLGEPSLILSSAFREKCRFVTSDGHRHDIFLGGCSKGHGLATYV